MLLGCHYEFKPTPFLVALPHTHGFQITNPAYVVLYFSSKDAAAMKTTCFHLFMILAKHCRRQSKVFFTDFHCSWWTVAKERDKRVTWVFLFMKTKQNWVYDPFSHCTKFLKNFFHTKVGKIWEQLHRYYR